MAKRTKNPLNKRLPRELKGELGKYLVIFLFFVMSISLVSGFLVADNSLIASYHESFDKYNIEDGNFEFAESATDEALANIEKDGSVKVYPNFYKEEKTRCSCKRGMYGKELEKEKKKQDTKNSCCNFFPAMLSFYC